LHETADEESVLTTQACPRDCLQLRRAPLSGSRRITANPASNAVAIFGPLSCVGSLAQLLERNSTNKAFVAFDGPVDGESEV
jgi:hypothetical protein